MRKIIKENIEKMRGISRVTAVTVIIIAIFSLFIALVLFRLNFLVGEDLRMTISPEYSEIYTENPEKISFDVDTKLYNKFVCDAVCNYTLTDISHNIQLDKGTFNSKAYKNKEYSFGMTLNYLGYGTNLYLYRVECVSIQTAVCPSDSNPVVRKSLFVVNYKPSGEQLSAADFSRKSYTIITSKLINASKSLAYSGNILSASNLSLNRQGYDSLKSELALLQNQLENFILVWNEDDYLSAKSLIVNNDIVGKSDSLLSNARLYNDYLINAINNHNNLITLFSDEYSKLQTYKNILGYNLLNSSPTLRFSIVSSIVDYNLLLTVFNSQNYNYTSIYNNISRIHATTSNISLPITALTRSTLSELYPSLYVYSKMLCHPGNVNTTFCSHDYSSIITINSIDDASSKLSQICIDSRLILDSIPEVDAVDSKEVLLMQYKLLIDYESVHGLNSKISSYRSYVVEVLLEEYNFSNPEILLSGYVFNSTLYEFGKDNPMLLELQRITNLCNKSTSLPIISPVTAKSYPISNISISESVPSFSSLNDAVPNCCLYNKCQSCDKGSSKNPLILVHGHSFNQKTQAYNSIEIFNNLEQALSKDKEYFQTGILVKSENSTYGMLGRYYLPLVSRPTYYIETYNDLLGLTVKESKTGNIDTYALRLKESIEYTQYITGSKKVDIIAHSMGGLVLRRYMQIFGTDDIGKVILVATPNQGLSERTYSLCKILGSVNECEDMRSEGIFIKKLNDLSNQPEIKDMYLIVGKGCETEGIDGDGVVSVNNSLIKGFPQSHTLYVEGSCEGTSLLHNDMLNPEKYPEVYEYVKGKLE